MRTLLLTLAFFGAALVQGQAQVRDDQIVHDVGDGEVAIIANRLGLRYEELGMGINRLGRGRYSFKVSVPDAGNEGGSTPLAERRKQALILIYSSSRKSVSPTIIHDWNSVWSRHFSTAEAEPSGVTLTAKLFLMDGVTFRTVLEYVRRFYLEIKAFETAPKRPNHRANIHSSHYHDACRN